MSLTMASEPMKALLEPLVLPPTATLPGAPPAHDAAARHSIELSLCEDISLLEPEWRRFELYADATVFQSFDWLSQWWRHIGAPAGVRPAIVLGRARNGGLLLVLPLAIKPGLVRRLTFLGDELADYNAPLIAPELAAHLHAETFLPRWREILGLVQSRPHLAYDVVELSKMPETIGTQANPLLCLEVGLNPSGAHMTALAGTWDEFYSAKRSSATRRRDRAKRKRLAEHGEVRFVNSGDGADLTRTLDTLMQQKAKAFACMGVPNLFARPGHRDFFHALASDAPHLVHASRLEVGSVWAAINLGLSFGGTYYHVLASYDDGPLARFGPGAAHLRDLLQRAIEKGFRRFDFTIGDERYKLEWSDTALRLFDHVSAATWRGWPVVFLTLAFRRLKRAIKQNPILWRAFSVARAAAGSLRRRRRDDEDAGTEQAPPLAPR